MEHQSLQQFVGIVDVETVEVGDDVARLDTGLRGGAASLDVADERTMVDAARRGWPWRSGWLSIAVAATSTRVTEAGDRRRAREARCGIRTVDVAQADT